MSIQHTCNAVIRYLQVLVHMFVAWIRSLHYWIRYAYFAIWPSSTSCTDQVKHVLKTAQVSLIFLQCWQYFFLPIFVSKTSSGVWHSSVDRLWDDDRLTGQTTRSERLQLTVLFIAHCWRCTCSYIINNTAELLRLRTSFIYTALNVSHWQYSSALTEAIRRKFITQSAVSINDCTVGLCLQVKHISTL